MNDGSWPGGLIFVTIGLVAAGGILAAFYFEKKRREGLAAEAAGLGLRFVSGRDGGLGRQYRFLNALQSGSNPYAENVVEGAYDGEDVRAFDFHYETHSTDSKGNRQTHHHWHQVYALTLPANFPELTVGRENFFTRIARNFGYPSIDFESHEFSRVFLVQSADKKFAYDVCHGQTMEYLLANRDLTLEIEGAVYAVIFPGKRNPGSLQTELKRLVTLRRLLPEYLFTEGV